MRKQCYFFLLLGLILTGCNRKANEFTVLQWNIWRERCPNVWDYPGFTYPSDNSAKPASKITWTPKADERERIDDVWYERFHRS